MRSIKIYRALLAITLLVACALGTPRSVAAQDDAGQQQQPAARVRAEDATGLEVQLHLLVASNSASAGDGVLPASLDAVVKQLRSTLVLKNYRLAATLLNRVKNGGRLNLRWVGGPLLPSSAATTVTPGFNEFKVSGVRLIRDEQGRDAVEMLNFNFGARIPIQVATVASTGSVPVVQYENTGITTDITIREGEPTVVGTLNVGPSGDALIIVVSAKRPSSR